MLERRGEELIFCGEKIDPAGYEGPLWPFLKNAFLSHGSRTALVNPYKQEEISYTRMVSLVECLARALYKLGVTQGKSLCILAPNSVENALLCLATIAVGGVVHAPNPLSVPGEVRRQLGLSEARLLVTIPQLLAPVREALAGMKDVDVKVIIIGPRDGNLNYDDLLTLGTEDVTLPSSYSDPKTSLAALLFSSGTTGLPKGVEITPRNIRAWIHIFSVEFKEGKPSPDDTVVLFLPFFHIYGMVVTLISTLVYGVRLVIMEKFDMNDYLTFNSRYKASMMFLVPPVIIGMVNHPRLSTFDLSHLRLVSCGAAPLGKDTEAQFIQKLGVPCMQGYGMTENMVATINTLAKNRSGSCGSPIANMEFKVIDTETRKCLGVGERGELYMRGPMTMRGYHKNPQATATTIDSQGWIDTGDVAYFDADGFMYIVDRKKELIKFKGEQVPPAMLEDLLLGHPAVADVCVIGKPDAAAGELPMAFVVKATGKSVTEQDLKDFVAKNVPSYMQLRGGVQFTDTIPKSPSGKILRRLLRDQLKEQLKAKL